VSYVAFRWFVVSLVRNALKWQYGVTAGIHGCDREGSNRVNSRVCCVSENE